MQDYKSKSKKYLFRNFLILRGISVVELSNASDIRQDILERFCLGEFPNRFYQRKILGTLIHHYRLKCTAKDLFEII